MKGLCLYRLSFSYSRIIRDETLVQSTVSGPIFAPGDMEIKVRANQEGWINWSGKLSVLNTDSFFEKGGARGRAGRPFAPLSLELCSFS